MAGEITLTNPEHRAELIGRVKRRLKEARIWTKAWSAVHYGFLFGAATMSAAAAVLLQVEFGAKGKVPIDAASILAALASLAGVIAGAGGFDRKWRTNRRTRARLEEVEIDLANPTVDAVKASETLKDIVRAHDDGIRGPAP